MQRPTSFLLFFLLILGGHFVAAAGPGSAGGCVGPRPFLSCGDPAPQYFAPPSGGDYYTHDGLLQRLVELETAYPDLIEATGSGGDNLSLGLSHRGLAIPYVRLSAAPLEDVTGSIFVNGMIHGREAASMMQSIYLLTDFAQRYGTDPAVTHLLDTREIYFAPLLNPDGWTRNLDGAPAWRRNHPLEDPAVDLNRNFPEGHDACNDPSCEDLGLPVPPAQIPWVCEIYPGEDPADQPETAAYMAFVASHEFDLVLNLHSFGRMVVEPDGCAGQVLPDPSYTEITNTFHRLSGYQDDVLFNLLSQTAGGGAGAWARRTAGSPVSIAPEIGAPLTTPDIGLSQSFDCMVDSFYPPTSELLATGASLRPAFLEVVLSAGPSLDLAFGDWSTTGDGADPGETVGLAGIIRSRGTQPTGEGVASVSSSSPWVTVDPGHEQITLPALDIGASFSFGPDDLVLQVAGDTPVGHEAAIALTVDGGTESRVFDLVLRIGTPRTWLVSDAEQETGEWTFSGDWGFSTENPFDGARIFSDSPYADYDPDTVPAMTLANAVDLQGWDNLWLSHAVRWDVWYRTDFAVVEATGDGGQNWSIATPPHGHLGYGNGVQRPCRQGYYGRSKTASAAAEWLVEKIDLSGYSGADRFQLRYRTLAAGSMKSEAGDGLDVDNIRLFSYPAAGQQITWTGTVLLDRDVVIGPDQTLVVVAGTEVLVTSNDAANLGVDPDRVEIIVQGRILVEGDEPAPVTITGVEPSPGAWAGIRLASGGSGTLKHATIRDAEPGLELDAGAEAELIGIDSMRTSVAGTATAPTGLALSDNAQFTLSGGGQLHLGGDLHVSDSARFAAYGGSTVIAADEDAAGGGNDPFEVEILCDGHLVLVGAPGNRVVLRSDNPGVSDWAGITWNSVYDPSMVSAMIWAEISDAKLALSLAGTRSIALFQAIFSNNETGIRIDDRDNDTLSYVEIQGSTRGLDLDQSNAMLQGSEIHDNGQGIYCVASSPHVRGSSIYGNGVGVVTTDPASVPDLGSGSSPGNNDFAGAGNLNTVHIAAVDPSGDIHAQQNWWGTVKASAIRSRIVVGSQNPPPVFTVVFEPFLTSPPN